MEFLLREARESDMEAVLGLIQELADYEKEPDAVINTVEQLTQDGFGPNKIFDCSVVEVDSEIVGFYLTYISYSTWKGRCLYLEDFYLKPEFRRYGIGKIMFDEIVEKAKKSGVKRMDWQVLEWNEPAINFYEKYGAHLDKAWYNGRLFFE
ncbi:MAG: GNAT family N-acetyltransferase [Crocinitomicaceae bacterium]